mmetsp:Transcript_4730/g.18955  ORF Transcript_4730/g.18955 Transcript_4730/m.18955 type:complete len:238 (-) Transcript_4730:361-1074(-)
MVQRRHNPLHNLSNLLVGSLFAALGSRRDGDKGGPGVGCQTPLRERGLAQRVEHLAARRGRERRGLALRGRVERRQRDARQAPRRILLALERGGALRVSRQVHNLRGHRVRALWMVSGVGGVDRRRRPLAPRRALSLLQTHLLPVPVVRVLGLAAAAARGSLPGGGRISGGGRAAIGGAAAIGGRVRATPRVSPAVAQAREHRASRLGAPVVARLERRGRLLSLGRVGDGEVGPRGI